MKVSVVLEVWSGPVWPGKEKGRRHPAATLFEEEKVCLGDGSAREVVIIRCAPIHGRAGICRVPVLRVHRRLDHFGDIAALDTDIEQDVIVQTGQFTNGPLDPEPTLYPVYQFHFFDPECVRGQASKVVATVINAMAPTYAAPILTSKL